MITPELFELEVEAIDGAMLLRFEGARSARQSMAMTIEFVSKALNQACRVAIIGCAIGIILVVALSRGDLESFYTD